MTRLPTLKAREVIRVLEKLGYQKTRQVGSHAHYEKPGKKPIPVPIHGNRDIGRGLLRKIIRDLEISREEFLKLLKN